MSSALDGADIVGKRGEILVIRGGVLHCDLGNEIISLCLHVYYLRMNGIVGLLSVEVLNERNDTALVHQIVLAKLLASLVAQNDVRSAVEECLLAQTVEKSVVIEHRRFGKNLRVGLEADVKTVIGGVPLASEGTGYVSSFKSFSISFSVVAVVDLYPLGKRVYYRRADAVKTAREFVAVASEFSSRVKHGVDHLKRGDSHFGVDITRNSASVVANRYRVILVDGYLDT